MDAVLQSVINMNISIYNIMSIAGSTAVRKIFTLNYVLDIHVMKSITSLKSFRKINRVLV